MGIYTNEMNAQDWSEFRDEHPEAYQWLLAREIQAENRELKKRSQTVGLNDFELERFKQTSWTMYFWQDEDGPIPEPISYDVFLERNKDLFNVKRRAA